MPAFDRNVFDIGLFDAAYVQPLLRNVIIQPEHKKVCRGSSVSFMVHIQQATYNRRFDLNPETSVQAEIFNLVGTTVALATMVNVTSGKYTHTYSVEPESPLGPYTVVIKATNGDKICISPKMVLFEVVI